MICRKPVSLAILALGLILGLSPAARPQGAKETIIEGQIKVGVHKFKLDSAKLYQIEVKAKAFSPSVVLLGQALTNTADFFKEKDTFRGLFMPPKDQEYTLVVMLNIGFGVKEGLLDYTVGLKTRELDETPVLKKEDKLTAEDPVYAKGFSKAPHKAYALNMKKGTTYVIDMAPSKAADNKLESFLFVENAMQFPVAQSFGGGSAIARIMFRPFADGEYKIVATSLNPQRAAGDFSLLVRTVKEEK